MGHSGCSSKGPLASEKTQRCNFVYTTFEEIAWTVLFDCPDTAVSFRYSDS